MLKAITYRRLMVAKLNHKDMTLHHSGEKRRGLAVQIRAARIAGQRVIPSSGVFPQWSIDRQLIRHPSEV